MDCGARGSLLVQRPEPVSYMYCAFNTYDSVHLFQEGPGERKLAFGTGKKLPVAVRFNFTEQNGASFSKKAQVPRQSCDTRSSQTAILRT